MTIINLSKLNIKLLSVYRPPSNDLRTFLNDLDNILQDIKEDTSLIGEVKVYNLLLDNDIERDYGDMIVVNGFQLINTTEPTRVTSNTRTLTDHIVSNTGTEVKINFIDHFMTDHKI